MRPIPVRGVGERETREEAELIEVLHDVRVFYSRGILDVVEPEPHLPLVFIRLPALSSDDGMIAIIFVLHPMA